MDPEATQDSTKAERNTDRFQILSLDGGGFKGLFSAAVLAKLEEKSGRRITDHFDLITGTSTGGLIAIGLGLGLSPREIVQFYVKEGPTIFGNTFGWRWCLQWVWRKYPQSRLKTALQSKSAFGDKLLGQSSKRLVIPAYNIGADQVRVFKTPHHPRLTTDLHIPAWKVALATTAAPTYFPSCQYINHTRLIDGGVWANNPAMVGVVEAISLLNVPLTAINVYSIGTTDSRKSRRKALNSGGIVQWLRRKDVLEVLMRGQSVGVNGLVAHLIGPTNYRRIDPTVPEGIFNLDRLTVDELLAEAEQMALHEVPYFQDQFCGHTASVYTPCNIARAA
jgi:uncharacterized protein